MFGKRRPQNLSTMLKKKAPNKSHIGEFVSDPDFPLILPPLYNPRTDQQSPVATGLCGSSTVSRFACCCGARWPFPGCACQWSATAMGGRKDSQAGCRSNAWCVWWRYRNAVTATDGDKRQHPRRHGVTLSAWIEDAGTKKVDFRLLGPGQGTPGVFTGQALSPYSDRE